MGVRDRSLNTQGGVWGEIANKKGLQGGGIDQIYIVFTVYSCCYRGGANKISAVIGEGAIKVQKVFGIFHQGPSI